jgi:hypothetical protein
MHLSKMILMAGLIASIAMAMVEMIYEGLWGVGFWSAPVFIAATVLRGVQHVALPVAFAAWPVILGLMGHMMNSVLLGVLFVALFSSRLASRGASIVAGMAYALLVFFLMWFFVLPLIDPVMLNLNPYVFALAHLVWGMVIGYMVFQVSNGSTPAGMRAAA